MGTIVPVIFGLSAGIGLMKCISDVDDQSWLNPPAPTERPQQSHGGRPYGAYNEKPSKQIDFQIGTGTFYDLDKNGTYDMHSLHRPAISTPGSQSMTSVYISDTVKDHWYSGIKVNIVDDTFFRMPQN